MKCPKCQFENREDAKFCNECGSKLEIACSSCGKINPLSSKFCNECGYNLTLSKEPPKKELSFDEKLAKIQRYLPEDLTQKILAQRDKIEGERKQVTVMFCDMEGFTPLVEKLGPEEAYSIMDQVYEILIHKSPRLRRDGQRDDGRWNYGPFWSAHCSWRMLLKEPSDLL